jgi:hypothetical protein
MKGEIIIFSVSTGSNRTKSSAFIKKFYGQDSTSHKGKYKYHRHGLLDDIPHHKLGRGVVIIKAEDVTKIVDFLEENSATFSMRTVILTDEDCEILGQTIE